MNFVSKNIKDLRRKLNLTQKVIGNKLGVNSSRIGSYEEGRATPPLEMIQKLSLLYGVPMESFCFKDLSDHNPPNATQEWIVKKSA